MINEIIASIFISAFLILCGIALEYIGAVLLYVGYVSKSKYKILAYIMGAFLIVAGAELIYLEVM